MEFIAVEKGLRSEGKTSTKRELIDINATPESDSALWKPTFQQLLPRDKRTLLVFTCSYRRNVPDRIFLWTETFSIVTDVRSREILKPLAVSLSPKPEIICCVRVQCGQLTLQELVLMVAAMHHLLGVKPHMMKQVLSLGGFCEEIKAASYGDAMVMELFPRRTGFVTTKHTGTCLLPASPFHHHHLAVKSRHQLEHLSLVKSPRIGVGGAYSTGASSASPTTTPHKKSFTELTIFYDGTVNVYDVSADQAQAIMNMLSGNGNTHELDPDPNVGERGACTTTSGSSNNPLFWTVQTTSGPDDVPTALTMPNQTATAEGRKEIENLRRAAFPLATKQSLQRFLQKRQIRLNSVSPCTQSAASPSKAVDDKLGAPLTLTVQNYPTVCHQ